MSLTLIIDDNQTNLLYMEALMHSTTDSAVVGFDCAPSAMEWCTREVPDLVLLDYMMPDLDGFAFLDGFRSLPGRSDIPVVMITTENNRSVRVRALEGGATDFLAKPIDPIEFRARTRNLLALRESQKQLSQRAATLAQEVAAATREIQEREIELVTRLSRAAEFRDPETGAHIQRMAQFSALTAAQLGFDDGEVLAIQRAAPMHDVGKLGIADGILLKPGRLSDDEYRLMRRHPEIGWQILSGSESPLIELAAVIALSHHEKFDGTGYPRGLAGEAIPLSGRIVAVADVFDALTSERPYKRAWSLEAARQFLLDNRGTHFDPRCVDAFLSAWEDAVAIYHVLKD